jgi:microcystin-dependent protein
MYAGNADLPFYLICDGRNLEKETYAGLYSVIGDTYTLAPNNTFFQIPDLRGRFVVGACGAQTSTPLPPLKKYSPNDKGGEDAHILTATEMPQHTHGITISDPGHLHTLTDGGHTHLITDPGHTHAITDPGHKHGGTPDTTGGLEIINAPAAGRGADSNSATTGITINNANTGIIGTNASNAGITVNANSTGISATIATVPANPATAHENRPPYIALCYLIKVA